jgi:hypothetical protein
MADSRAKDMVVRAGSARERTGRDGEGADKVRIRSRDVRYLTDFGHLPYLDDSLSGSARVHAFHLPPRRGNKGRAGDCISFRDFRFVCIRRILTERHHPRTLKHLSRKKGDPMGGKTSVSFIILS